MFSISLFAVAGWWFLLLASQMVVSFNSSRMYLGYLWCTSLHVCDVYAHAVPYA